MKIFYELIEILGCFLSYFYLIYVISIFCKYRSSSHRLASVLFSIAYMPITYDYMTPFDNMTASLISMLYIFVVALVCFNDSFISKLLIVLIYNILSVCFSNIFFLAFSHLTNQDMIKLATERSCSRVCAILTLYLLELAILFMVTKIKKIKQFTYYDFSELVILLLFIAIDFAFAIFTHIILHYQTTTSPVLTFAITIMSIFCLASTLLAMYIIECLQKNHLQSFDNMVLNMQMENIKTTSANLEITANELRKFKHDVKNKFISYKTLIDNGKSEQVSADISQQLCLSIFTSATVYCSNATFNSLLNIKAEFARSHNIKFTCKIFLDPDYDNLHLMVALSNLLDNALEHEAIEPTDNRSVKISIVQDYNNINIVIANYISHSILKNNPALTTTKENQQEHGMGIRNARSIIHSLGGIIEFTEENNTFYAQILL